jgi:GNAT superfamily N-acetyltransferase
MREVEPLPIAFRLTMDDSRFTAHAFEENMARDIDYVESPAITAAELAEVFRSSGINRPVDDPARLEKMLAHANLVIGAYADGRLVGVARGLTDFSYCCYLSDLAVAKDFQHRGIGRELLRRVRERIGDQSMLLLLSAPAATGYYPKVGFEKVENGWIIKRDR